MTSEIRDRAAQNTQEQLERAKLSTVAIEKIRSAAEHVFDHFTRGNFSLEMAYQAMEEEIRDVFKDLSPK